MPVFTGVRARRRRSAERAGRRELSRRRSLRGAAEENLLQDGSSNQAQHFKNTAGLLSCRVFVYGEQFGCLHSQEFARGGGGARSGRGAGSFPADEAFEAQPKKISYGMDRQTKRSTSRSTSKTRQDCCPAVFLCMVSSSNVCIHRSSREEAARGVFHIQEAAALLHFGRHG